MKTKEFFAFALVIPWFPFYGVGYLANFTVGPAMVWFSEGWKKAEQHMKGV